MFPWMQKGEEGAELTNVQSWGRTLEVQGMAVVGIGKKLVRLELGGYGERNVVGSEVEESSV